MKIAVVGLGKMGMQIARKLSEEGHEVIGLNRSPEPLAESATYGIKPSTGIEETLQLFGDEQVIVWLMIPSEIVESQIEAWLAVLPQGSILIDGGNSDYRNTQKLGQKVADAGCNLIDCGTSGGVWGYQNGFSMMIGGDENSFLAIEPIFQTLSMPEGAYRHFGPSGAGHFVKMTHNAIEYGMMQSLAEGYRLLKEGPYQNLDLAAAGNVWQHHSVVTSWLNELAQSALTENPELTGIDGYVAESGEARWALETAKELGLATPAIQASFDVRLASQQGEVNFTTKLLAAMRNKFGGHDINNGKS